MAWLYLKLPGGVLKIKPRSHLRTIEIHRQAPTLDLGFIVLAWWSHAQMIRDAEQWEARGHEGRPGWLSS
jgi:hypothetical protein